MRWHTQDKPYFTDTLPVNVLNVGFIARALPHAKFLHVTRDPMDTCFSSLKEHFPGFYGHTYDQGEMAEYYKGYRQLMAHWRRLYPDRILDVRYGELTIAPAPRGGRRARVPRLAVGRRGSRWKRRARKARARGGITKRNWHRSRKRWASYGYSARD